LSYREREKSLVHFIGSIKSIVEGEQRLNFFASLILNISNVEKKQNPQKFASLSGSL
jgi:hypothetical protein